MRCRVLTPIVILLAVVAASCGGETAQPAADRTVSDEAADWERDQAIERTVLIENAMENGLTRSQAACVIDAVTDDDSEWAMADLDGIDLSAQTSSNAPDDLAADLADALVDCGPQLTPFLEEDIPGALTVPSTHDAERECVVSGYVAAWRDAYTTRFDGGSISEPTELDVSGRTVSIVAGCEAGGAVILGASNAGHLDTHTLTTLAWECLVDRLDPDQFMPAFPFPDEPGDALDRMGTGVLADATFCEEHTSPGGGNS